MALGRGSDTEIYSAKNLRDKKTCQMARKDKDICHSAENEIKFVRILLLNFFSAVNHFTTFHTLVKEHSVNISKFIKINLKVR